MTTAPIASWIFSATGILASFGGMVVGLHTVEMTASFNLERTISCGSAWSPVSSELTEIAIERCAVVTSAHGILAAALLVSAVILLGFAALLKQGRAGSPGPASTAS